MKKIFKLCVVAVMVVLAASCNRKVEFEHTTFATFGAVKYNVPENAGSLSIPVILYNATGVDTQISVAVDAATAVENTDFEIVSPANDLLTFTAGIDTLYVEVAITSMEGEFTGAKDFSLKIASLTEGVSVGNYNIANVTIADLDHPLAALAGDWAGEAMFATNPPTPLQTVLNLAIDANDDTYTKLIITGWEAHPNYAGYALPVTAVYDSQKSTIYIPAGQAAWGVDGYGFVFYGFDGTNAVNLELAYDQNANTLTQMNYYGCYSTEGDDQGWWSLYQPGAVFTKQ